MAVRRGGYINRLISWWIKRGERTKNINGENWLALGANDQAARLVAFAP
jgi:hypothetical protein